MVGWSGRWSCKRRNLLEDAANKTVCEDLHRSRRYVVFISPTRTANVFLKTSVPSFSHRFSATNNLFILSKVFPASMLPFRHVSTHSPQRHAESRYDEIVSEGKERTLQPEPLHPAHWQPVPQSEHPLYWLLSQ